MRNEGEEGGGLSTKSSDVRRSLRVAGMREKAEEREKRERSRVARRIMRWDTPMSLWGCPHGECETRMPGNEIYYSDYY